MSPEFHRHARAVTTFAALVFAAAVSACLSDAGSTPARDAGAADAQVASDAGQASDADAGKARYCATAKAAAYCEDFDGTTSLQALDVETNLSGPNPFAFTREVSRSDPRALRFDLPAGASAPSYAVYKRAFDGTKLVRVEWDWLVSTAPEVEGLTLQFVTLKRRGPQVALGRACSKTADGVRCDWYVAQCTTTFCDALHSLQAPPFLGTWARVFLEARLTEQNGRLRFGMVGAAPLVDVAVDVKDAQPLQPGDQTVLSIGGANLQGTSPGVSMFFDNVVVTTE